MFARKVLIAVLAVLLAASAAVTLKVAGHDEPKAVTAKLSQDGQYRVGGQPDDAAVAAVRATVKTLPVALSYDFRSLDKGLEEAKKGMTPGFAVDFEDTFDKVTRTSATEKEAIASASVRAAGAVGEVKNNRATVLVYLDQVLLASKTKKADDPPKVIQSRVTVELRKIKGVWRISGIDPF